MRPTSEIAGHIDGIYRITEDTIDGYFMYRGHAICVDLWSGHLTLWVPQGSDFSKDEYLDLVCRFKPLCFDGKCKTIIEMGGSIYIDEHTEGCDFNEDELTIIGGEL